MFSKPISADPILQSFIEIPTPKENKELEKYADDFNLFYSEKGFILRIKAHHFYNEGIINPRFDKNTIELLPFLKNYNDRYHIDIFFWSTDGKTFYQMEDRMISSINGTELYRFSTPSNADGSEKFCRIEFTQNKASLLEPEIKENKKNTLSEKVINEAIEFEFPIRFKTSPPSPPPAQNKLIEFKPAPKNIVKRLLYLIQANKIDFVPYRNHIKPICLIKIGEYQLLYGKSDMTVFKCKENNTWTDVSFQNGIGVMDGSDSIFVKTPDHPVIKQIAIQNPHQECLSRCLMHDGQILKGEKIPLDEETLKSLAHVINDPGADLRPTPLDLFDQNLSMRNYLK